MVEASVLTKQEFLQPTLPCFPFDSSFNTRNMNMPTSPGIKPLPFVTFKMKSATRNCGVCVISALWRRRLKDGEHNTSLIYTAGPLFSPLPPHPKKVKGIGVKKKENSKLESKKVQDNISHYISQKPLLAFQIDNCVPGSEHRAWRMSHLIIVAITL